MQHGSGILCAGLDLEPGGEENFLEWHTREHLVERLGLPGFLRGRRFARPQGSPRYLILYEVEDLSVLASPQYIACLDNPTPWTRQVVPTFRNGFRSACTVSASGGAAEGGCILALRLAPADPAQAQPRLGEAVADVLPAAPGVTRARLALPDRASSTIETEESRASRNVFAEEWLLLVEGVSEAHLASLLDGELSPRRLSSRGVATTVSAGIYRLQARMEPA